MLTNLQKLKILQNLLCLVAVNAVYNSGQQCNKEGKEKKVFAIFEAELAHFAEQKGRWTAMKEFTPMECPRDQIRQATKNSPLTSEKIWYVQILYVIDPPKRCFRISFRIDFSSHVWSLLLLGILNVITPPLSLIIF